MSGGLKQQMAGENAGRSEAHITYSPFSGEYTHELAYAENLSVCAHAQRETKLNFKAAQKII